MKATTQTLFFVAAWLASSLTCTCLATTQALPASRGVSLMTSSGSVHEGLTKLFYLNCSFTRTPSSDLASVKTLILAKSDSVDGSDFKEIAKVTAVAPDTVNIKNSLGANVTGQLTFGGVSFIHFTWLYPDHTAAGRYRCQVKGLNPLGQPVEQVDEVVVEDHSESLQNILAKMQKLEATKDALVKLLNVTQTQLNNTQTELNHTKTQLDQTKHDLNITKQNLTDTKILLNETLQQCEISQQTTPSCNVNVSQEFPDCTVYNKHRYLLSVKSPWYIRAFQARCQQLGGYLVEFDTRDEWTQVTRFLANDSHLNHAVDNPVAVGLTDEGQEGHWTFMTSQRPAQVLEWGAGEPSGGRGQNCALLGTFYMKINDVTCVANVSKGRFMCEVPL